MEDKPPLRSPIHPAVHCSIAGLAAATLLSVNDAVLVRLTFGTWALPGLSLIGITALLGLLLGWLTWSGLSVGRRFRRDSAGVCSTLVFAVTFALLYGLATALRFTHLTFLSQLGGWAPPVTALIVWLAVVFAHYRVGAATGRGWLGVVCAGFFLALFLIGNRELVGRPTSGPALLFDITSLVFAVLVVLLLRGRRRRDDWRDRGVLVGAALLAFLVATAIATEVSRSQGRGLRVAEAKETSIGSPKPHVVLLVFDTMRGDVFEDVLRSTEEGRAFADAAGGVTWFQQATAAAPWTAPSMSSILTGTHPLQHQVMGGWSARLQRDQLTLGEHLRTSGYQTLALVANRALERSIGVDRGFQVYEGLPTATDLAALGKLTRHFRRTAGAATEPQAWFVDARQARRVLEDRLHLVDPEHPVFLWYHLMDTHGPLKDHSRLRPNPGDEQLTSTQRAYRNNARFALAETALALRSIEAHLPAEETLLIVVSDHGEMLPADNQRAPGGDPDKPRTTGHGHAYHDTLIRVPMGVRLPKRGLDGPQRKQSERLVSHLDIVPTIVDVLELGWPQPLQGCSLVALSTAAPGSDPEHCHPFVVSEGNSRSNPHASLRTPHLKLMASRTDAFAPQFFDLGADPHEQVDRSAEEPEATASALALLRRYWEEYTSDRPASAGELAPEQIETLRALGYLN